MIKELRKSLEIKYTLGDLISDLKEVGDKSNKVWFDFGHYSPKDVDSWRGSYAQLAIEPGIVDYDNVITVEKLLKMLIMADGATFGGYKGGEYTMDKDTPVWADVYGCSTCTRIVGLGHEEGVGFYLITEKVDYNG